MGSIVIFENWQNYLNWSKYRFTTWPANFYCEQISSKAYIYFSVGLWYASAINMSTAAQQEPFPESIQSDTSFTLRCLLFKIQEIKEGFHKKNRSYSHFLGTSPDCKNYLNLKTIGLIFNVSSFFNTYFKWEFKFQKVKEKIRNWTELSVRKGFTYIERGLGEEYRELVFI